MKFRSNKPSELKSQRSTQPIDRSDLRGFQRTSRSRPAVHPVRRESPTRLHTANCNVYCSSSIRSGRRPETNRSNPPRVVQVLRRACPKRSWRYPGRPSGSRDGVATNGGGPLPDSRRTCGREDRTRTSTNPPPQLSKCYSTHGRERIHFYRDKIVIIITYVMLSRSRESASICRNNTVLKSVDLPLSIRTQKRSRFHCGEICRDGSFFRFDTPRAIVCTAHVFTRVTCPSSEFNKSNISDSIQPAKYVLCF